MRRWRWQARWGAGRSAAIGVALATAVMVAGCSDATSSRTPPSESGTAATSGAAGTVPAYPAPLVPSPGRGLTLPPVAGGPAPAPAVVGSVTPGADWTTYHGDAARTGFLPTGPDPASPALAWQTPLDGQVYGSPLVVGGRVLVVTEGGSMYGLDARTGAVQWRTHLADPLPGRALPCGNIDPIGLTGTPVYDPATDQVFAVTTQAGVTHVLYALEPATGAIRGQRSADAPGSLPATQLQRGALLISNGTVYVPYGGNYGDCGPYLGRVIGLPTVGSGPMMTFSVPTPREGGIWAASGPAALPNGDLIVTTGNGEATSGDWDHSDSMLRLRPDLSLLDGFAPQGWAQENSVDADLGSTGPVLLPGTRQAIAAGKGGGVYLVDLGAMGGVGAQRSEVQGCQSYGGGAAAPVTGGGTVAYLPCTTGLLQVRVSPDGQMTKGWQAPPQFSGSPVVVGSTVWSLQQDGALVGLDAATGTVRAAVSVGDSTRFATPAASGNALYLPTNHGVTAVRLAP